MSRRRTSLVAVAVAVVSAILSGCQTLPPASTGVASPAGSSPVVAASPGATPAAPTPDGRPVSALFTLDLAPGPFLGPADGPPGSLWAMPAAGTRAQDGTLVLVIVWFDDGTTPPKVTIATSADGLTWTVGTNHIFGDLAIGNPNPGPIPAGIVQLEDGTWQLYGWSAENASGTDFFTWRTSAPTLDGPWTLDAEQLLPPGPAGDWDSQMAAPSSVLRTGDGFALWYEGEPPGSSNRGDIGLATSSDGLAWTKFDDPATADGPHAASDPVIPTGICGSSTSIAVEQGQVERLGDRYVALFGGFAAVNSTMELFGAVSDDGRAWRCGSPEALLTGAAMGGGDAIHTIATIPLADGRIGLITESIVADHSELWWADVTVAEE